MDICKVTKTNMYTLKWRLVNYYERAKTIKQNKEDYKMSTIQSSPDGFQARIDFISDRHDAIAISYMSKKFQYLASVRCYLIKIHKGNVVVHLLASENGQWVTLNEWHSLVALKNFKKTGATDNLTLKFEFEVKCEYDEDITSTVINDMRHHLLNKTFSDIILKTSDGDELPAHKILLVARSDVFRAHFEHNTVENTTNIVECPFETDVIKDLLSYIYTNEALDIDKTASKLLAAADFYHLDELKDLCQDVLEKKLDINNAVEILNLATAYGAENLKVGAILFIKDKKNAPLIVKTKAWKTVQSLELAKSIFEFGMEE